MLSRRVVQEEELIRKAIKQQNVLEGLLKYENAEAFSDFMAKIKSVLGQDIEPLVIPDPEGHVSYALTRIFAETHCVLQICPLCGINGFALFSQLAHFAGEPSPISALAQLLTVQRAVHTYLHFLRAEPGYNHGRTMAKWVQIGGLTVCFALSLWVFHRFAKKQAEREQRLLREERQWEAKLRQEARDLHNRERGAQSS